jgi:beta-glucuronidase
MADSGSVNKQCLHLFSWLFVGIIDYNVRTGGGPTNHTTVSVSLLDQDGNYVIRDVVGHEGNLQVPQAKLWWPYLMDPDPAYLYTVEVR